MVKSLVSLWLPWYYCYIIFYMNFLMDDRPVEGMIFAPLVHYLMITLLLILTVQQTPDEPYFLLMVTIFTALFFFNISGTFLCCQYC